MSVAQDQVFRSLLDQGMEAHRARDWGSAERCYRQALSIYPNDPQTNYLLACIAHQTGNLQPALDLLNKALAADPSNGEYLLRLGMILADGSLFTDAAAAYQRALKTRPRDADLHNLLAVTLRRLGRADEARKHYLAAGRLNPNLVDVWYNLANLELSERRYAEAKAGFRKAIALRPDLAVAYNNLGRVLEAELDFDGALAAYRRALEIEPDHRRVHSNLLFLTSYNVLCDPERMLALHRECDAKFGGPEKRRHYAHKRDGDPNRRLRIGYVSRISEGIR